MQSQQASPKPNVHRPLCRHGPSGIISNEELLRRAKVGLPVPHQCVVFAMNGTQVTPVPSFMWR